ncbi:MAG: bifunctional nuclease family protein [Bacteroides sp.]|nr:bifunctional nuclease family protein [Bacteroides sp.]
MSDSRIRLKVMGLSVGQIKQGAYALILEQTDGPVKIPVVIGESEARAIASRMEHKTTPRPLVYDLFASFAMAYGIANVEVFIHKFEAGIFYSEISFTDGERRIKFDSRTSDAIAIAMRTGAPIYTTREILNECGFILDESNIAHPQEETKDLTIAPPSDDDLPIEELEKLRSAAEEREDYEEAARLTEIINKKNEDYNLWD